MMGRHPHPYELAALHDGELPRSSAVGRHARSCLRCARALHELAWVDGAVSGNAITPPFRPRVRWRRSVAMVAATVVLVYGLASARSTDLPTTVVGDAAEAGLDGDGDGAVRTPDIPPSTIPADGPGDAGVPDPDAATPPVPTLPPDRAGEAGGRATRPAPGPLRLATIVPDDATLATEITAAVRAVVETANEGVGVGGEPVEMVIVRADDTEAIDRLPQRADVVVGGLGPASVPLPWFLPADVGVDGPGVISPDPPLEVAAQTLAAEVRGRLHGSPLGIVTAAGRERSFGAALATAVPSIVTEIEEDERCWEPLKRLRRGGAAGVAVAAPPALVGECVEDLGRIGWAPRAGALVPPTAAHRPVSPPLFTSVRSVLGLPWPTWDDDPGAKRFRANTRGRSYESLISFAAAELAVAVAQSAGAATPDAMASGYWYSDLWQYAGTVSNRVIPVLATRGGWVAFADDYE